MVLTVMCTLCSMMMMMVNKTFIRWTVMSMSLTKQQNARKTEFSNYTQKS